MLRRNTDAVREVEKAVSLDPLSLIVGADLAEELLVALRYDEAIEQSRKTVSLDPFSGPAHFALGEVFAERRMFNDAITEFRKAVDLSPGSTAFVTNLAHAYALLGMKDEAGKILADLTNRPGGSSGPETALGYLGLREKDQAPRLRGEYMPSCLVPALPGQGAGFFARSSDLPCRFVHGISALCPARSAAVP
jgi:tetratricopeptide (TPR) repeat protein